LITVLGSPFSVNVILIVPFWDGTWTQNGERLQTLGPFPFEIPSPDGLWHSMDGFGIKTRKLDAGFFDKMKDKRVAYKPAFHGELDGSIQPKVKLPADPYFKPNAVFRSGVIMPDKYSLQLGGDALYAEIPLGITTYDGPLQTIYRDDVILVNRTTGRDTFDANPWITQRGNELVPTSFGALHVKSGFLSNSLLVHTVTSENCRTVRDDYSNEANSPEPGLTGFPYMLSGINVVYHLDLRQIKNDGFGFIKVSGKLSRTSLFYNSLGMSYVTSNETEVELPLALLDSDNPGFPEANSVRARFRGLCGSLDHLPSMIPQKKECRTRALIAIEDLGTNNLENISGLKGIGEIVKTLVDGYKAFKNLNIVAAAKALASAYLIYKFAIEATGRDVSSMRKAGPRTLRRIANIKESFTFRKHSQSVQVPFTAVELTNVRLSAEYILWRNTDFESILIDSLDSIGLLWSPGNLWDLVPLSFVVDWFVNIGNWMDAQRLDRDTRHYRLIKRIESQKFQFRSNQTTLDSVFGTGWCSPERLTGKLYRRRLYTGWGSIDPVSVAGGSGYGFQQMLYSGALVIQRL
jgi:hypothetical protein